MVEPMLGAAVSPTMISASTVTNVIPGLCEVTCDFWLLPATRPPTSSPRTRGAGRGLHDLEWVRPSGHSLAAGAALGRDRGLRRRGRPWRRRRSGRLTRVHGQPLPAPGLRHGRVRLLPHACDGSGSGGEAHPFGGRAHRARGSRPRGGSSDTWPLLWDGERRTVGQARGHGPRERRPRARAAALVVRRAHQGND